MSAPRHETICCLYFPVSQQAYKQRLEVDSGFSNPQPALHQKSTWSEILPDRAASSTSVFILLPDWQLKW
jgi:hypothetical protein